MTRTIQTAIEACDGLRPGNKYTIGQKIIWLSELDGKIYSEVLKGHEGFEGVECPVYDDDTPTSTELLIQGPYGGLYEKWLICQVDRYNMDVGRYNSSMPAFSAAWAEMEKSINREHMPVQRAVVTKFM